MLKTFVGFVSTFQTVMGSTLSQQSAVDTIIQWRDKPRHDLIFDSGRREVSHYFEAFDRLRDLSSSSTLKSFNNDFLSAAMDRLTHEFDAVLRRQSDQHPGPISATESTFTTDSSAGLTRYEEFDAAEPPSRDAIDYLRNIAQRMSSSGNLRECVGKYKAARKSFLHAQLKRVRFHDLSFSRRSSDPNEMRLKMDLWVHDCKICVKILFQREKKLCDQIFQGLDGNFARDECFVGTVEEFAIALFNFADAVSLSNQPYEKMESILGVFNSFVWVLPDVNQLFDCELGKGIRGKCQEILSKVEDEVSRMLHDFGKTVLDEISSPPDERGAVHSSTVHVMDQIAIIVKNKDLLANLIKSAPSMKFGETEIPDREALGDVSGLSFLDQHLILILEALQVNLEAKCRAYKNLALGQLFMMNNVRFISRKVKDNGNLREMIGESYVRRLDENVKVAMGNYQELTCGKFLACFEDEGLYHVMLCIKPRASKSAVRKRVKDFNALYEEFRALHTSWTVQDSELRDEVRVSLCGRLVPAYLEFLDKLRADPKLNVLLQNNVKYSGEDFEALILEDLFAHKENIA